MKTKNKNEKGKIKLSRMFQNMKIGEKVAVNIELAIPTNLPKRLQGKIGIIEEKRGKAYIVKIIDGNKGKKFIIDPVHLTKIK